MLKAKLMRGRSYLILVRPPVREMCLNAIEDLWLNCKPPPSLPRRFFLKLHIGLSTDTNIFLAQPALSYSIKPQLANAVPT